MLEVLASGAAGIAISAFIIGKKLYNNIKESRLKIIHDQQEDKQKIEEIEVEHLTQTNTANKENHDLK